MARKAKILAEKLKQNNEKYAEDMFLLDVMHDLDTDFTKEAKQKSLGSLISKSNDKIIVNIISKYRGITEY